MGGVRDLLNPPLTRRSFLRFCMRTAALMGGGSILADDLAEAFVKLAERRPPVIWLTGQACTGDSMSLVYSDSPSLVPLLSRLVDLRFHPALSVAQGGVALKIIEEAAARGGFVLCFEGAVPMGMPEACKVGERTLVEFLEPVLRSASAALACGTCASYGGIPASNPETGAVSLLEFAKRRGIKTPIIRLPGCPTAGHRIAGTAAWLVAYGAPPPLDKEARPRAFYERPVHEDCQRFQYFVQDKYVMDFEQKSGCLYCMGCKGPVTPSDCSTRRWNRGVSWCVQSNAPCVGCADREWPWPKETGIYRSPARMKAPGLKG